MARLVAQRFVCERLAGSGGMGHVWRAHDRLTGQPVALKLLRDEDGQLAERFLREARALARLEHPAVVRYVSHGEDHGELYLAMEWLEGQDLSARLERGRLAGEETLVLLRRLAQALQAAHQLGIVHRDLKPANVFLPGDDLAQAKLLDFGVARLLGATLATRAGAIIGTPAYMSPEQARGDGELDGRSDLFSLGSLWLECLSGRPAFAGTHVVMVLAKVLFEEPVDLAGVELAPHLRGLLARLLAKSRDERPASAGALLVELDATPRPPPITLNDPPIGRGELRRFFVVVAAPPDSAPLGDTSTPAHEEAADAEVRRVAGDTEVRLERLVDGSWVGAASVALGATDAAARVARSALALARALPGTRVSAATGRGVASGRVPAGEVIERAALLARAAGEGGVRIDDGMAGLLDARFELGKREGGFLLLGERPSDDGLRTLLGRPSPCVGRDRELAMLRGTLASCESDGVARAVLITAPPGTGKSRLRRELVSGLSAQGRPLAVWTARADTLSAGASLGLLAQLVRSAAGIGGETGEPARKKLETSLRRWVPPAELPRVTTFLAELAGLPAADESLAALAAARRDPVLLAEQVQRAWEDLVVFACHVQPVLIVLEDLHWGDAASVRHLGSALRRAGEAPLLVLALARPEVHDRFPDLWRDHGLEEIHLPQLPRRAAERLVRHSLPDAAAAAVERVVGLAAGNCFYLEELIRALASGHVHELPESVLAMAQGRYELLADDTRRILRVAAIMGESFWQDGVRALLADDAPVDLDARLASMAEQELLERRARSRFAGQKEYAFRHALLREAAYAALPEQERRVGHGLACTWLEQAGELESGVLAEHAARAEAHAAAARHFTRAAEQALEAGEFDAALARVKQGRQHGADAEIELRLDLAELEARKWKGQREAVVAAARRVVARAQPGSSAWCRGFPDAAPQFSELPARERALAAVTPQPGAEAGYVVCLARLLTQSCIQLRLEETAGLFERLETMAAHDASLAGWLHQARGFRAVARRDLAVALRELRASALHFGQLGDERNALAQLADAGEVLRELGLYAESAAQLEGVVERCTELRLTRLAGFARFNRAWSLSHIGGAEALRHALDVMEETLPSFNVWRAWVQYSTVTAYLRLGDLDRAEAALRQPPMPDQPDREMISLLPLEAELCLRRGRPEEALRLLPGLKTRPSVLNDSEYWGQLRRVRVEALLALGRIDEARAAAIDAMRELHAIVDAVSEPGLRAGMIQRVIEYRRLAELAGQLGIG